MSTGNKWENWNDLFCFCFNQNYLGFMKAQMTIKNGERWSTDRLIYKNNNERLKILTNSFVTKVILSTCSYIKL